MPISIIQSGFATGEISPSLLGRTDLAKWHQGALTCRNFFVNYRGGASSRAGTAYVGMCKQGAPNVGGTSTTNPPRDIPFQFSLTQGAVLEFGDQYMRVKTDGAYVVESAKAITAATNGDPGSLTIPSHGFSVGDWIFIQNMGGLTLYNGLSWVVTGKPDSNTVVLSDLFGSPANTTVAGSYTSGGTAARVYTLATPYNAVDLPYLKYTQSADTMTLTCVNQATHTEYQSYELQRQGPTLWVLTADTFASSISPPTGISVTAQSSTTVSTWYSYVVTAVDAVTGEESIASAVGSIENNDIAVNAGSNTITWAAVAGAGTYNVYKATPSYSVGVPIGSLFGYAGTAYGTSFTDTNITADFTHVPPTHQNPFASAPITAVTITNAGSGYAQSSVTFTITSASGAGFAGTPVVSSSGGIVAFIIENGGENYEGATIAFSGGSGSGATGTVSVGPSTGNYPSVCAYYQQRRVYSGSLNNPDTQWYSQVGAFNNFDSSIPTTDDDAITATPWSQQIDGVQFMVPMPGGLVTLAGRGAWQINGGSSAAITPSDITATPQAYNGCNNIVQPIVVNYDVLFLQSKGSIFRDLAYNFFTNIYTGTDLTILSSHLFTGYTFSQWCWAEEPYKVAWAVRNDGVLLSLTYLKEQDIYAWAQHDTNGLYMCSCSITEPPVDAVYLIVKRYIRSQWVYYAERMDNRNWSTPEDAWCVDAGLSYPQTFPNATLTAAAAAGTNNITATVVVSSGIGYTAPTVIAVDPTNSGSGAEFGAVVTDGVIAAVNVLQAGENYAGGTFLSISDPTGTGAEAVPLITNNVSFATSASVFSSGNVGDVIRTGGGIATIVEFINGQSVIANITSDILAVLPDNPQNMPVPQPSGSWSISTPVTAVSGLNHLEGMTVSIVADGSVAPSQVVTNGSITLDEPASAILVGLPFIAQLQTPYLDVPGEATVQGKRKNIFSATVRVEASRGLQVGTNQVDASTQPGGYPVTWTNMYDIKERNALISAGQAIPLFTGDHFVNNQATWDTKGQVAVQQIYPMPANVLAIVFAYHIGDTNG